MLATCQIKAVNQLTGNYIDTKCCIDSNNIVIFETVYGEFSFLSYAIFNDNALIKASFFRYVSPNPQNNHPIKVEIIGNHFIVLTLNDRYDTDYWKP